MLRRFASTLLILCLSWQSLALAGLGALVAHEDQEQHELLHFQGVAHHHDEHGDGIHEDDSMASTMHVLADSAQFSPALPSPVGSVPCLSGADQPFVVQLPARAFLLPDGLDRPPKRST
jgi:hypothetical protein